MAATTVNRKADEPRNVTYDELLDFLGEWWVGPVLDQMRERSNRRGTSLLDIMLHCGRYGRR